MLSIAYIHCRYYTIFVTGMAYNAFCHTTSSLYQAISLGKR